MAYACYPSVPDVARAKQLAHGRHGTAVLYTGNGHPTRESAAIIKADLKAIGITVDIKTFSGNAFFNNPSTRGAPFDIFGPTGWAQNYLDPADTTAFLLDGTTIKASGNNNTAYFNDPAYNRRFTTAAKLTGAARYRAKPSTPPASGCQVYSPSVLNADLAALCIRGRAH